MSKSWKVGSFLKIRFGFRRKTLSFLKTAKGSNLAVHCDWMSNISPNVQKLASFWEKKMGFSKKYVIFLQIAKSSKCSLHWGWISNNSQNDQKSSVFLKKKHRFFRKEIFFRKNLLKVANLQKNATEKVRLLKTFEIWFY